MGSRTAVNAQKLPLTRPAPAGKNAGSGPLSPGERAHVKRGKLETLPQGRERKFRGWRPSLIPREPPLEGHAAPGWTGLEWYGQFQPLGFTIHLGLAMPMSAAQEGLASSKSREQHTLRALRSLQGWSAPLLSRASAKTPGSTSPVPGQRVYEQILVQGINEEGTPTSCAPPREKLLYHSPLR